MQLPDSVQNILAYGQGYQDGMKEGHVQGFHDCLVCMIHTYTGILKDLCEQEKEYSALIAKFSRERMKQSGGADNGRKYL